MTATDLERKVRQHDNDISAVYTMIADIQNTQRRHTNRFNELTEDVAGLSERMTSLETGVTSVDTRMTSLEAGVTSLDTRMTSLETRMTSLQGKVDQILDLLQG